MIMSLSKSWIEELKNGKCRYITWCKCNWKFIKVIKPDGYSYGEQYYLCEMDAINETNKEQKHYYKQLDLFDTKEEE